MISAPCLDFKMCQQLVVSFMVHMEWVWIHSSLKLQFSLWNICKHRTYIISRQKYTGYIEGLRLFAFWIDIEYQHSVSQINHHLENWSNELLWKLTSQHGPSSALRTQTCSGYRNLVDIFEDYFDVLLYLADLTRLYDSQSCVLKAHKKVVKRLAKSKRTSPILRINSDFDLVPHAKITGYFSNAVFLILRGTFRFGRIMWFLHLS